MRQRGRSSRDGLGLVGLVLVASWATAPGGRGALADERPKASSAVQVQAQGGGGVEPVPGAPPPVPPSLESRPVPATLLPAPPPSPAESSRSLLRALATAEGEATLELDGVRETVRPGSRLGRDLVKSVGPGRVVLERSATAGEPAALVIVTFDETGRAKTRVFWKTDPTVPVAPEVNRP